MSDHPILSNVEDTLPLSSGKDPPNTESNFCDFRSVHLASSLPGSIRIRWYCQDFRDSLEVRVHQGFGAKSLSPLQFRVGSSEEFGLQARLPQT